MRINRLLFVVVILSTFPIICTQVRAQSVEAAAVTVPAGQQITVVLQEELDSQRNREGDEVMFAVRDDVIRDGKLVLAEGTPVLGEVVKVRPARSWGKSGAIGVEIRSIALPDGQPVSITTHYDCSGDSNTTGLLTGMAIATTGVAVAASYSSQHHPTSIQPFVDGLIVIGVVVLDIAVGSASKGKRAIVPPGTEVTLEQPSDFEYEIASGDLLREQVAIWWRDRIIENFLAFSWKKKVTVRQALETKGVAFDESVIDIQDMNGYKKRLTVDLGGDEPAIFEFAPFDDVPDSGMKFKPLTPVNIQAREILKLVK